MLEKYFETTFVMDRLRSGPSGPYVDGFAQQLEHQGYSWWTIRGYLRAAAHLGQFAQVYDISLDSIGRAALDAFRLHLPSCRCPRSNGGTTEAVVRGAKLFVAHLCEIGVLESWVANEEHVQHPLVESFREWLLNHRGAAESTRRTYGQGAGDLLEALGDDPGQYDAQSLRAFVRERAESRGVGSAKSLISALRMFLRYLAIEGKCRAGLDQAIPALAGWRLAALPRSLDTVEVDRIIACCEPTSAMGLRDRAILLLLARLGLRAGDVAALCLSDIDWGDGSLVVSGKGRREARLPIPQEVGDAILEYIEQRPRAKSDAVFLRMRVPVGPFRCAGSVSMVVRRAMLRAGISAPSYGAHILRHTAATHMLDQGISLLEISSVLRHRSLDMSAYYAKIDANLLRQVAQPWTQVPPC
jgi:integrase